MACPASSYLFYVSSIKWVKKRQGVSIVDHHPDLTFLGMGRSAVVFKLKHEPRVIKVFYPPFEQTAVQEKQNYDKVQGIRFYPKIYESGPNYLVMDFIAGKTFFQCLAEGIPLKDSYVKQVDTALVEARNKGLNPSDIHLHNLLVMSDDQVRIIDIARFSQTKRCQQWHDLKKGYQMHYHRFYFPKKVPKWLMNGVAWFYQRLKTEKAD
ncbi:serine/threonine protein kinases [Bacillus sp. JCM 19045]|nr:serine/threonine protein kinases [Bacillus sp. JCM 19045]